MLFKFGDLERSSLRLYRDAPPTSVNGCAVGVDFLEQCMDRICLMGNDGSCHIDEDMHLIVEAMKVLKETNTRLERLAIQLNSIHPSLLKPLIGPLY
jgi:hypothetical protein